MSRIGLFAIAAAMAVSVPVAAGSNSAPLSVGVTVVRSCAVRATPLVSGSARFDLRCASGAAQSLDVKGSTIRSRQEPATIRLETATSPFRGSRDSRLEVATLNF